jgi:3-oxoacyl-[acyl-carrier-protein] synthase II
VGNDVATAWKSVCEGKSGVTLISRFVTAGFPSRIAAEVHGLDLTQWLDRDQIRSFERVGLNIEYGTAAAIQAVTDSGLDYKNLANRTRFGVYTGAGEGAQDFDLLMRLIAESCDEQHQFSLSRFSALSLKKLNAEVEYNQEPNVLAAKIAGLFGAEGPSLNTLTACAASAQAIGEGTELVRNGTVDIMLVGGSHSMIHPFGLTGFGLLGALSTRNDNPKAASRPFDRERDGFVIGEGAAMLVLEEYEAARRRRAHIYGEVRGYGVASDAYRLTDIPDDGNGLARAMAHAMRDAGIAADQIAYVNAHGTSTGANDRAETQALKRALGTHAYNVPISSTKSMTGHLVAACGALEAVLSLLAIRDNIAPPTVNYEFPDPDCDLDYVPNIARNVRLDTVMSNNSGFGGQNVSLILSRV